MRAALLAAALAAASCQAAVPAERVAVFGGQAFVLVAYMPCTMPEVLAVEPRAMGGVMRGRDSVLFCYWIDAGYVFVATEGGSKFVLPVSAFQPIN